MYTLITNDYCEFLVDRSFIDACSTLRMCMDMIDTAETIPLPNVDAPVMETIRLFFTDGVLPEPENMIPVLLAADFLGYETLLDEGSKSVAEYLKGKSKNDIDAYLQVR